jgi:RNA polymerase sigma-70 factor, ECF subfamily
MLGDFDVAEEALHDAFRAAIERWPTEGVPANPAAAVDEGPEDYELLEDDGLRLIFTCRHPSFAEEAQIAPTLREVCVLTTEEITRAFLHVRRAPRFGTLLARQRIA